MYINPLLISVIVIYAQRETIWNDPLTGNTSQWLLDSGVYISSSTHCPSTTQCVICPNNNELWRYESTIGFHSIQLHYTLQSLHMTSPLCEVYYIIGEKNDITYTNWVLFDAIQSNNNTIQRTLSIPGADNNSIVGVDFLNHESKSDSKCYLNNVSMTGIPLGTTTTRVPLATATATAGVGITNTIPYTLPTSTSATPIASTSVHTTDVTISATDNANINTTDIHISATDNTDINAMNTTDVTISATDNTDINAMNTTDVTISATDNTDITAMNATDVTISDTDNTDTNAMNTTDVAISATNNTDINAMNTTTDVTISATDNTNTNVMNTTETSSPIIINATCLFSDDFLKISILFHNIEIEHSIKTQILCSDIFIESEALLDDSTCIVTDIISIQLSSNAVVHINDILYIKSDSFSYIYNSKRVWNTDIMLSVASPLSPVDPVIVLDEVSIIGAYDDLILNAAQSMNLGGRNAMFEWEFVYSEPNDTDIIGSVYYGDIVVVDSNAIDIHYTMYITLWLTTWYNKTMVETLSVYKSSESIPHVVLSGPSVYSDINYKDYINIDAVITYNDPFIAFPYWLLWSIPSNILQTTELISIEQYLNEQNELRNIDNIAIDTSLLYPGNDYTFRVDLICYDTDDTVCDTYNTSASLTVMYEWSDIVCSMYYTDAIYIDYLSSAQFMNEYVLYLDGYTMTYDPNTLDIKRKSYLNWQWQCQDEYNVSCNHLFDSSISTESTKYITFEKEEHIPAEYHFVMSVSDDNTTYCMDTLDVYVNTTDDNGSYIQYISLMITTSSNVINSNDRLRIMLTILNDEISFNETSYYQYEWIEINQQISSTDLTQYNLNTASNGNLIFKENVLGKGKLYQFRVTVTKWKMDNGETMLIGNGVSSSIDIYILDGPRISGLNIYPNCKNKTYSSLIDVFNEYYYISVLADGEYTPLSYEFAYIYDNDDYPYNIHRSVLSQPYLYEILLPFGSFSIQSIVYDFKSSMTQAQIQCDIRFSDINTTECLSLSNDIIKPFQYASNQQLLLYLLQSTEIYLHYIQQYHSDMNILCVEYLLTDIINVYNDILIQDDSYNFNFCTADWTLFFGKILTKYVNILIEINADDILISNIHTIQSLITDLIFDPCSAITDIVHNIDLLSVSSQSIIDGNPIIYYKTEENDITYLINQDILSDTINSNVLYELSSAVITLMQLIDTETLHNTTDDIFDLISKSLYIHTLFQISSSIPGETTLNNEYDGFEIYSSRIGTDGIVDVSVDGIEISIGNDAFAEGRDSFCDITEGDITCGYDSVDVIITSTNNTKTNVQIKEPCSDNVNYGTVANYSVNIILIGGNVTASNISIVFNDDDDNVECVWLNETDNIWKNTGCTTVIDHSSNTIECDCNHLTTFSLAHNINLDKCNQLLKHITNSIAWTNAHIVFGILFFVLLCHTLYELLPFIIYKHYNPIKQKALLSLTLVGVISFINILICVIFASIGPESNYNWNSSSRSLFTFLLLCPQWVYFVIFSIVLYSWMIVVYRSQSTSTVMIGKSLMCATIGFILYGFLDFVFISFISLPSQLYWMYSVSQIIWIVLILLATVTFTIFGYATQRIVRYTARKVQQHTSSSSAQIAFADLQLANKLLLVTIVISIFFILQCVFLIYFLIMSEFNHQHMLQWRICDLLSHLICLIFLSVLYRKTLIRLRAEYELKPLCYRLIKAGLRWYKGVRYRYRSDDELRINPTTQRAQQNILSATCTGRSSATARSVELGVYRKSGLLPLPTLGELNEERHSPSPKASASGFSKKHKHNDSQQFISQRKELLKLSTAQLAKQCRKLNVPSNGRKGEIVNRLLRYRLEKHKNENEKESTCNHHHHHHLVVESCSLSAISVISPSQSHDQSPTPNLTPKCACSKLKKNESV